MEKGPAVKKGPSRSREAWVRQESSDPRPADPPLVTPRVGGAKRPLPARRDPQDPGGEGCESETGPGHRQWGSEGRRGWLALLAAAGPRSPAQYPLCEGGSWGRRGGGPLRVEPRGMD